jgi:hypothetical protein
MRPDAALLCFRQFLSGWYRRSEDDVMNDLQIARGGGETEGNGLSQRGTWRLLTRDSI